MTMNQVQSFHILSGSAKANPAGSSTSGGQALPVSFVETLNQALGDSDAGTTNADIAASLAAGMIPAGVLLSIVPQANADDTKQLAETLLAFIQSADPAQLDKLFQHPALRVWLNRTGEDRGYDGAADGASMKPALSSSSGNFLEAADAIKQQDNGENLTEDDRAKLLKQVLGKLEQLLHADGDDALVQRLVSEFKEAAKQLESSFPSLFAGSAPSRKAAAKFGGSDEGSMAKLNKPLWQGLSFANDSKDNSKFRSQASSQPLLQRLSFMRPIVPIMPAAGVAADSLLLSSDSSAAMRLDETSVSDHALSSSAFAETLKVADLAVVKPLPLASVRADQFAAEMSRFMVKNMSISQLSGASEAKITLLPEHLGQLDVKITVQNGQITAQFVAESAAARDLLENQLPQLRSALQQQGLQVDKLVVSHQQSLGSGMFQDSREQKQPSQRQPGEGNRPNRSVDAEFTLETGETIESNRMSRYGSSFHASA